MLGKPQNNIIKLTFSGQRKNNLKKKMLQNLGSSSELEYTSGHARGFSAESKKCRIQKNYNRFFLPIKCERDVTPSIF